MTNLNASKTYHWGLGDLTMYNTMSLWMWGREFVPGQTPPPYPDRVRPNGGTFEIAVNQHDYLTEGPGKHFRLALSNVVQFFFEDRLASGYRGLSLLLESMFGQQALQADGSYHYSAHQVLQAAGIEPSDASTPNDLPAALYQYMVPKQADETYEDYLARTFAIGSEVYKVTGATFKIAANGQKSILNAHVTVEDDDFNFDSQSGFEFFEGLPGIQSVEELGEYLDPNGIHRDYDFRYTGVGKTLPEYTSFDFQEDNANAWVHGLSEANYPSYDNYLAAEQLVRRYAIIAWAASHFGNFISRLEAAGIVDRSVIYGTAASDVLRPRPELVPEDNVFVGGAGADSYVNLFFGDEVYVDASDRQISVRGWGALGGPRILRRDPNQPASAGVVTFRDVSNGGPIWVYAYERDSNTLRVSRPGLGEIVIYNYQPGNVGISLEGEDNATSASVHCFVGGTPILLSDGSRKPIECVAVGDRVFAFDPNEQGGRGELHEKRVTQTFSKEANDVVELNGSLRVTLGHVFFTANGEFKKLAELSIGDNLVSEFGVETPIVSIKRVPGRIGVYNFAVEDLHTYVAGGYRVHNESIEVHDEVLVGGAAVEVTIVHHQDDGTIHIWRRDGDLTSSEIRLPSGQVIKRSGRFSDLSPAVQSLFENGVVASSEGKTILQTDSFEDIALDDVTGGVLTELKRAEEIGRQFGAQLGAIIDLDDPFADIVLDSVLVVAMGNLAEIIKAGGVTAQVPMGTINVLDGLPLELLNEVIDDGQAYVSDYLAKRLIVAIGIEGIAGELLEGLTDAALNELIDVGQQILNNLMDDDPSTSAYDGVDVSALKDTLRAQAETILTAHLQSLVGSVLDLDADIEQFVAAVGGPLIDAAVDAVLDTIHSDEDADSGAFSPEAIRASFMSAAETFLISALDKAVIEALGIDGQDIGDQFGRELSLQIINNVVGAAFDPELFVFDENGINFDTVFAGASDISARFIVSSVVSELGLQGAGAAFVTNLGTQVVSNIAQGGVGAALNGINFTNVWVALAHAAGAQVWSDITDSLRRNQAGQVGGTIGSIIGSYWGPIGSMIGEVIGSVVGSWFGKTAEAGAQVAYDLNSGVFHVNGAWKQGGASRKAPIAIAGQVAGALNGVLDATNGQLLNAPIITPGHYGIRKDYFTYREAGRNDRRARFNSASELVSFGVFNALEEMEIGGGNIYIKRALYRSLERQADPSQPRVTFSEDSAFGATGNDLEVLLGDLATGADFARYIEETSTINGLIAAEPTSFFAAGWTIVLQRAIELGLYKRHASDWVGGWSLYLDEKNDGAMDGAALLPANISLELNEETSERLVWIRDSQGNWAGVIRDTIDTASKDRLTGSAQADTILVDGDTVALSNGWTLNGESTAAGTHVIRVAALIDGGAGDDIVRGGGLGNDLLGGQGNDALVGGMLDDWEFGGAGNDRLFAGNADIDFSDTATDAVSEAARDAAVAVNGGNGDYLDGGEGDDSLYGGAGSDWLNGGAGADHLRAGAGGDMLDGGAGDDRGANGEAMLLGGAGSDQYVFYYGAGNDVIFDSANATATAGSNLYAANTRYAFLGQNPDTKNWAGGGDYAVDGSVVGGEDAISFGAGIGFENISLKRGATNGVANSDLIIELSTFNENGQRVASGDTLTIRDWFDDTRRVEWLRFADGQDIRIGDISSIINGANVGDSIIGTNGNDWAVGSSDDDDFHLLNGDDFGFGGKGEDFVGGDGDNDFLSGGDDDDIVSGGAGHDTVFGDAGNDLVEGNGGADIVVGGRGDDRVVGGAGNDLYRFSRGDGRDVVLDDYAANTTTEVFFDAGDFVNDYERTADWRALRAGMAQTLGGDPWTTPLVWDAATGTLRERTGTGPVTVSNAGFDTFEFGFGIDIEDVQLVRTQTDLIMAVADGASDASAFMAIADRITFEGWVAVPGQIEQFSFFETGLLDITTWDLGGEATDGADTLSGDTGGAPAKDWLTGGLGDDVISGGDEEDILSGNHGADTISGGAGTDIIYGGGDNDLIDGGAGADLIFGGSGEDIASYASNTNQYTGVHVSLKHAILNTLDADGDMFAGIEGLEGSSKNDELWGDEGDNVLRGLGGNDTLKGDLGDDTYEVNAGEGHDVIADFGVTVVEVIDENGLLRPGYEVDWVLVDRVDAAPGLWWYYYQLTVTGPGGGVIYQSRENVDFIYDAPQVNNPPPPSAWPFGNGQWLAGARSGNGAQTVIEGAMPDDGGSDTLEIGAGVSLDDITATKTNNGADLKLSFAVGGSVTVQNHFTLSSNERRRAVEELLLRDGLAASLSNVRLGTEVGTIEDDLYLGGSGADNFNGGDGDDVISGGGGDDNLVGGQGNDTFEGGLGADQFDGGDDGVNGLAAYGDTIRYVGSSDGVQIDLAGTTAVTRASGGDAAGDTFIGIENVVGSDIGVDILKGDDWRNQLAGLGGNDTLLGRGGDDALIGGDGADYIDGGDGKDNIDGGAGDDRGVDGEAALLGGAGDDVILGGDGDDAIDGGAGADFMRAGTGADIVRAGEDNDIIHGDDGADFLYGDDGDDVIADGAGVDHLYGGEGNDTLGGGAGNDVLYGGAGDDAYVFNAYSGADQIIDADGAANTIVFDGVTFDKIWMAKIGNDLTITLSGSDSVVTIKDYYAASGASRMRSISAGDRVLYLAHAETLITAMTTAALVAPASAPPAIGDLFATYWEVGSKAAPRVANQSLTLDEDGSVSGSVAAVDPDDQALSYALHQGPAHGTLTFTAATGAWTYQPDAHWNGADGFDVAVTDTHGQTSIEHIALAVTAMNDAPTIIAPVLEIAENAANGAVVGSLTATDLESQAVTFNQINDASGRFAVSATGEITVINGALLNFENGASYQVDVVATDAEGGATAQTITISLSDVNEAPTALAFANAVSSLSEAASTAMRTKVADLVVTDDALGSESFALSGADAALFEIVDGALYLIAGVNLNYEAKSSYNVTVSVDDAAVGASPDASQSLTLGVSDANEAPTALALTNITASLSDTTSTDARIHVADLVVTDDALGAETFGLTGADAASFEIYNGALYLKAGVTLDASAKPNYAVQVTVDDPTLGSDAELTQAFALNVGAGLSLALANATTSMAENTSTADPVKVADLLIADDVGTPVLSLTGADAASFEIIANALYLKAGVALNFETKSAYSVSIVMDEPGVGSGPDLTRDFTLTVSDVNEAPTALAFANTTTSIAENTSTATRIKVADLGVTDDALGSETFALTGADASSFEIIGSTLYLKAGVALNFEAKASYSVNVTADDTAVGASPDLSQTFTLSVANVNEAPTALSLTNTTTNLAESASTVSRVKVADISVSDDALGSETIALAGADAASFEIYNGALYLKAGVALNYETKSSYAVTVTVDDPTVGATPDLSQSFTLSISDVNEAPTAVSFANTTTNVAENTSTATRTKVADIAASDDALGSNALSLGGADAASFEIIGAALYLKASVALNFETKSSYSVTVNVDDAAVGLNPDASQNFTLTLADVNEAPALNWSGSSAQASGVTWNGTTRAFAVPETLATGVTLGRLLTADPDGGAFANLRYELTGANANRFTINATTGDIALAAALNYEASPNSFSVGVTVWDGGAVGAGLSSSGTITIAAANVNEAPVGSGFWYYYGGSVGANTTVGTVSASDPEGSAVTYSIYSVSRDIYFNGEVTTNSLATSTYSVTTGGLVKVAAGASVPNGGVRTDTVTIKVTDASGNFSYVISTAQYDRSGGGGYVPPIVFDLNGDGVTLVAFADSTVAMDVTGDGLADAIGWVGADDALLALDRNGDGVIAGVDEIMFTNSAAGAASDLEGLRAYDTNNSGFIDAGDAQFDAFKVWQDANQDGVAQTDEVTDLAGRQISAINLTLTLTGQTPNGATDNVLYGTTTYTRTDGTLGTVGDVFLHYVPTVMRANGLPPIIFDLDGGGLTLTSRLSSNVRFDADNDGVSERIGWFGAGEGVLALDRNGDGAISSGAEISFVEDFAGAVTDLEGLVAFDTNLNGFFDDGDARFGEFVIWQDANQDGVSQAPELRSLAQWDIVAVNLTPVLTGASVAGAEDNVIHATSAFVRGDGTRGVVGDVYLSFDESSGASAPTGQEASPTVSPNEDWCAMPGKTAPIAVTTGPVGVEWCGVPDGKTPPSFIGEDGALPQSSEGGSAFGLPRLGVRSNVPSVTAEQVFGGWRPGFRPRTPAEETPAEWCGVGSNKPVLPLQPWCATTPEKGEVAPVAGPDADGIIRTADNVPRPLATPARPRNNRFDWIDHNQIAANEDEIAPAMLAPARNLWRKARAESSGADASSLVAEISRSNPPSAGALQLVGATASAGSTLHSGLAVSDKRVLHMVNAMASFGVQSASDLARTGSQRDPKVAAMLTSLPDLR
ncbi:MAG: cadherin domain-containing protein [Phycisphaerales bacterium]|nr:cadherin domain-containing protein [Hyphomonadaceae bacterium]